MLFFYIGGTTAGSRFVKFTIRTQLRFNSADEMTPNLLCRKMMYNKKPPQKADCCLSFFIQRSSSILSVDLKVSIYQSTAHGVTQNCFPNTAEWSRERSSDIIFLCHSKFNTMNSSYTGVGIFGNLDQVLYLWWELIP